MGIQVDMRVAELLCSKLCHDLIGPMNSVSNGLELIGDVDMGADPELMKNLESSSGQALARLEFFRMAFGLQGGGSGQMSISEARDLAYGFLDHPIQLNWPINPELPWSDTEKALSKDVVKVALNLVLLGKEALVMGGLLNVSVAGLPEGIGIAIVCSGPKAAVKDEIKSALSSKTKPDMLSAHTVHAYFMARLADDLGLDFEMTMPQEDMVQIAAIIPLKS